MADSTLALIIAGVMMMALTFYALMGGADFGGGVWDLLACGPRANAQRELIAEALAPIWEANHVWLILVIVLLFVAFPPAFATVMVALHIPLTVMLFGIVLRGAAFTFRHYDTKADQVQRRWGRLFAIASTVTPIMLGVCIGAIASGRIRSATPTADALDIFFAWLAPFPFAVGGLALALFTYIAAVFLTVETSDKALQEDFRKRALLSAGVVFVFAWLSFFLSGNGAPKVHYGLLHTEWAWPFHICTSLAAIGAIWMLVMRRYFTARICASLQIALILWGWGAAQFPYLVEPEITIENAAAPRRTLELLVIALAAGTVLLFPSFFYLYRLFKGERAFRIK